MAGQVDSRSRDRRRLSGGAITSLVAAAILLIFMVQNTDPIVVRFLILRFRWPLWLYTIASAVVGALIWFGLGVVRRHRRRVQRR